MLVPIWDILEYSDEDLKAAVKKGYSDQLWTHLGQMKNANPQQKTVLAKK